MSPAWAVAGSYNEPTELDPDIFLDALALAASSERRDHATEGLENIVLFSKSLIAQDINGSSSIVLSALLERLCHCCHEREWYQKWAGAAGIDCLQFLSWLACTYLCCTR